MNINNNYYAYAKQELYDSFLERDIKCSLQKSILEEKDPRERFRLINTLAVLTLLKEDETCEKALTAFAFSVKKSNLEKTIGQHEVLEIFDRDQTGKVPLLLKDCSTLKGVPFTLQCIWRLREGSTLAMLPPELFKMIRRLVVNNVRREICDSVKEVFNVKRQRLGAYL